MSQLDNLQFLAGYRAVPRCGRVLVINGHPDPRPERFCAALCDAYEEGARLGGMDVRRLIAGTAHDRDVAFDEIRMADRMVIVFPLWLDRAPALLVDLFREFSRREASVAGNGLIAECVITMDLPAFAHRALFRARNNGASDLSDGISLPGLQLEPLMFIGGVNTISAGERADWLQSVRTRGLRGA